MLLSAAEDARHDHHASPETVDGSGSPYSKTTTTSSVVGRQVSDRELQVVELLVDGLSNAEIGAKLKISERTVQAHVASARTKLNARSRTHLAVRALQARLLPLRYDTHDDADE